MVITPSTWTIASTALRSGNNSTHMHMHMHMHIRYAHAHMVWCTPGWGRSS